MELNDILRVGTAHGASDIHLRVGIPPMLRIQGNFVPVRDYPRLTPEHTAKFAAAIMTKVQKEKFSRTMEMDMAYGVRGLGRYRVNVFRQRMTLGLVFRTISSKILGFEELNLPPVIKKIADENRGLVLVTGTTGSGKSTTLAAMIDYINNSRSCHILTIEDPIEFMHRDKRAVITQREVGVDTVAYAPALRSALRQDPDIILVGEMRDLETVEIALEAAETGHLVMSTLHTMDATETITRVVSLFPPHQQDGVRLQLAGILRGVISQRLVPRADGKGRLPAIEVLVNTGQVREYLENPKRAKEISDVIARGKSTYGSQTFDQSLYSHYKSNLITYEDALKYSSNPDDFALRASGVVSSSDNY
ncbi:MAG: type IV pilus twitching motility protein PilT [Deltaproteobacteria bacterium]|nr:type IV pilus twitching motility protein PilT [Deltaproteobacteria bacterium]